MESNRNNSVESLLQIIEEQKRAIARSESELKKLIPDLRKEISGLRQQATTLNEQAREIEQTISVIADMGTVAISGRFKSSYNPRAYHTRENCPDTTVGGCIHHADSC